MERPATWKGLNLYEIYITSGVVDCDVATGLHRCGRL